MVNSESTVYLWLVVSLWFTIGLINGLSMVNGYSMVDQWLSLMIDCDMEVSCKSWRIP